MGAQKSSFVNLAEYQTVRMPRQTRGNVIKAPQVILDGKQEIGAASGHPEEPLIRLVKEGDRVTSAEFICKCGRCATLSLEYEQE